MWLWSSEERCSLGIGIHYVSTSTGALMLVLAGRRESSYQTIIEAMVTDATTKREGAPRTES